MLFRFQTQFYWQRQYFYICVSKAFAVLQPTVKAVKNAAGNIKNYASFWPLDGIDAVLKVLTFIMIQESKAW